MVNLKEGQLLKVLVKVLTRYIIIAIIHTKWVDVTLAWPREQQKNCKTLKTSDPTWVSICCLHFSFRSALVSSLIALMTF